MVWLRQPPSSTNISTEHISSLSHLCHRETHFNLFLQLPKRTGKKYAIKNERSDGNRVIFPERLKKKTALARSDWAEISRLNRFCFEARTLTAALSFAAYFCSTGTPPVSVLRQLFSSFFFGVAGARKKWLRKRMWVICNDVLMKAMKYGWERDCRTYTGNEKDR